MALLRARGTILPSIAIWLTLAAPLRCDAQGSEPFAPPEQPRLLADLRRAPQPTGSDPILRHGIPSTAAPGVGTDETLYFLASDDRHGRELWQLPPGGSPMRLTDVCPGPCDSMKDYSSLLAASMADGRILVRADDGETGEHLWITDGTETGTRRLTPPIAGARVQALSQAPLGGLFYFSFVDRLWRTDGTPEGTGEFDAQPVALPRTPRDLVRVGDRMVFSATDSQFGHELWSTDGTASGTVLLTDSCPDGCGVTLGTPAGLRADATGALEILVYSSQSSSQGSVLWATGGTPETTRPLVNLCPAGSCYLYGFRLEVVGGRLAFGINNQIWWTDGTLSGTESVATLPDFYDPELLAPIPNGILVVTSFSGHWAVWRLPTTGALPTAPIREADLPGSVAWGAAIQPQGPLLFGASSDEAGYEVWTSDGTAAGTRMLADLAPGIDSSYPGSFTPWNDAVVFAADDPEIGRELLVSDGTDLGTTRVADLRGNPGGSDPREFTALGDQVLFVADATDRAWWNLLREFELPGDLFAVAASQPNLLLEGRRAHGLTPVGDRVFFVAENLPPGPFGYSFDFEPWITDGTAAGTQLLVEIEPGTKRSYARDAVALSTPSGERILFFADRGLRGAKIWITDGTGAGTELVTDIDPSWDNVHPDEACTGVCSPPYPPSRIYPREARVLGDQVVFIGHDPDIGEELWITDGTEAGTNPLADLEPGPQSSNPGGLVAVAGRLFFTIGVNAYDEDFSLRSLWVTDGTAGGTTLLVEDLGRILGIVPLATPAGPRVVLLSHRDLDLNYMGYSLWISDGTPSGTQRLTSFDLPVSQLTAADDLAYFALQTADRGVELARTDGTADGTFVVRDLRPGERGSAPYILTTRGREVIFAATDGTQERGGTELWISAGASGDTRRLASGGPRLHAPTAAHSTDDGRLFFAADDGVHGSEPWAMGHGGGPLCSGDGVSHCLSDRFRVRVDWHVTASGESGVGQTLPGTRDTGYFWFFGPDNVELAVKVLDGTSVNGHHWLFYGALSDVEYTIHAEDLVTGFTRTYTNPSGNLCGGADIEAFREPNFLHGLLHGAAAEASRGLQRRALKSTSTCGDDVGSLCLQDRFEVTAVWQTDDAAGNAQPIPFGDTTGMFWFFGSDNVELLVKVLDGRPINGKYWVFYDALSDVEYTIRVVDTQTGEEVSYFNPRGNLCGGADVGAFAG